ncbi:YaaR family protein [Clostridium tyrobutyricum]|uniref:YaaR family protein n=1 Tax=Clostridium tyrobutyricum TaxID=1519 RepID=UPI001C3897D1|nr:YaaR family protein [Clostridium tyrobutyricum]MBV4415681.1 YaaR family protein [Clostridium tyrobutyricum]
MEISRVGRSSSPNSNTRSIKVKKDFSESFNSQMEKKSHEQLKDMFNNIKKKGNRLSVTKCYSDVKAYKNMIKEYLKSVLNYMYTVKKDISFWQTQYFITVETIDNKLEELTSMLMNEQKDNLSVASTIDDISGLLVDIYK